MPPYSQKFTPTHEQQLEAARLAIETAILAISGSTAYIEDYETRLAYIRDTGETVGNLFGVLLLCGGNPRALMVRLCDSMESWCGNPDVVAPFRVKIAEQIPTCLEDADGTCGTDE